MLFIIEKFIDSPGIQSYEADQRKAGFSGKNVKPLVTLNILQSIAAERRSASFEYPCQTRRTLSVG
jgi:hypothetical protein